MPRDGTSLARWRLAAVCGRDSAQCRDRSVLVAEELSAPRRPASWRWLSSTCNLNLLGPAELWDFRAIITLM